MDDSKTFREELAIQYPVLGRPLWEPDPGGLYDAVQVGDVGFIRHGYFHRLFNALAPGDNASDHPPESQHEHPSSLQPLQPRTSNHIRTRDRRKDFRSKNVTEVSRGRNFDALGPDDDSQITYSCSGRQGALLYLPFLAEREDTVALGDFGKWIVKNIYECMRLAEDRGLGVSRMEDIILVTGRHLAKSWARAVFSESRPGGGAQASFCARVSRDSVVHLEERDMNGAQLVLGPNGEGPLPENQCIFIRGYHVVRVLNIWPRLRAMAEPAPDPHEYGPESDTRLQLIGVPADTDDPLHTLMEYIAEQTPTCDMVLVHDDDLKCIEGAIPPLETLQPDALMRFFRVHAPTIHQFQCEISPRNESHSEADVAIATVATLSPNMFEVSLDEGSISNPISTSKTISTEYQRPSKRPSGLDEHAFAAEFGKYRSTPDEDGDIPSKMPSSLSIQTTTKSSCSLSTSSIDRTQRPSISHTCCPDDEGCEDETCLSRAKSRVIDDGGRRRSLPTNIYTLEHGADANSRSALHRALERGDVEVSLVLLEDGEDPNAQDKNDATPLHLASHSGHVKLVLMLLEHGADANARDKNDITPLHWASERGHVDVSLTLLEHDADANAQDKNDYTPLHWASERGHVEAALMLLEHGADANAREKTDATPLHLASYSGHAKVALMLLEHGADANAQSKNDITPLHWASECGHVEAALMLLEHGADVNAQDKNNLTSLHWASERGHVEISLVLLDHDVDANARDKADYSPLHWASERGHVEVATVLLEHGVDANARDKIDATPLHLASHSGHVKVVLILLEHGADANAWDKNDATPLHLASYSGHAKVALMLLKHGADENARDKHNHTPLHLASGGGHAEVARVLLEHGVDAIAGLTLLEREGIAKLLGIAPLFWRHISTVQEESDFEESDDKSMRVVMRA